VDKFLKKFAIVSPKLIGYT